MDGSILEIGSMDPGMVKGKTRSRNVNEWKVEFDMYVVWNSRQYQMRCHAASWNLGAEALFVYYTRAIRFTVTVFA